MATVLGLHTAVKYEIDKTDSLDSVGFRPEEYDYWLNSAIREKVKRKFSGSGVKGEAFEQHQKRIDDLRTLVGTTSISVTRGTEDFDRPNVYKASLPSSYWFTISEEVQIVYPTATESTGNSNLTAGTWYKVEGGTISHDGTEYSDGDYFEAATTNYTIDSGSPSVYESTTKRQGITETTSDYYTFQLSNPYSEYIFYNKQAKPLRLFTQDQVILTTDGEYGITHYYLKYLKSPQEISVSTISSGNIEEGVLYDVTKDIVTYDGTDYNPGETFVGTSETDFTTTSGEVRKTIDLPQMVHDEIIKEAANMMLENTGNPRYQTHTIEERESE